MIQTINNMKSGIKYFDARSTQINKNVDFGSLLKSDDNKDSYNNQRDKYDKIDTETNSYEPSGTYTKEGKEAIADNNYHGKRVKAETKTDIIVKPDGSRVLVITTNIGGMESTMSLQLSKPTDLANEVKMDDIKLDNIETDEFETDEFETDEIETDNIEIGNKETDKKETDNIETDGIETDDIETDDIKAVDINKNDSNVLNVAKTKIGGTDVLMSESSIKG